MRLNPPSTGRLDTGLVRRDFLIQQTIDFVWDSLLPWRNDPDRPSAEAEEELNGFFCDFLADRAPEHCPMVIFRHEQKQGSNRRVDIAAKTKKPFIIEGITYSKYTPILLIEGKRLPTPSKSREREYLTGHPELSGGVQRFKLGLHGKDHDVAILLGYIQKGTPQEWHAKISTWVEELTGTQPDTWSRSERLSALSPRKAETHSRCSSGHSRTGKCRTPQILLHHFWVSMPIRQTQTG